MTKFKYGVFLPFYAFQTQTSNQYYRQLKNIVLECERLGYDSIWLDDHLMYGNTPILECWTTLSALAATTSKIRLGIMVTCNTHRNPALVAKAMATMDVISDGRLEFGIGAGVQEAEHEAYGFSFPPPSVRIAQLEEAIEVIRRLWVYPKASYQGKYYTLKDAVCEPKPKQKPHPPIIVGGGGEKYTLKVAAKYADRFDWGFLPSIEVYKHKLSILKRNCELIGRDFRQIELSCWPSGQILIAADQRMLKEKIAKYKPANASLEEFKQYTLIGTAKECIRGFQAYIDLGVTYFLLYFADLPSVDGLRLFKDASGLRD
ncbi:MAG: TIGR03560 family F420-dependent LLM class oxidoreductase [Nitrososphaerota archaeon]|nr:TIGR03560 family F420-dependent LLM class oxidoreductase [Nitrososphaerota archaeon]